MTSFMKYYSEQELDVLQLFKKNGGQVTILYTTRGKIIYGTTSNLFYHHADFLSTLSKLLRKGVIKRKGTRYGNLRFSAVLYELCYKK